MKPQVLGCLLLLAPAFGTFLKRFNDDPPVSGPAPPTPEETEEKWDNEDNMVQSLFLMGCSMKHAKDVDGLVGEQLSKKEIKATEVEDAKKKVQASNVAAMQEQCGKISLKGNRECRADCVVRIPDAKHKIECDTMCNNNFNAFRQECGLKAKQLQVAYGNKLLQEKDMQKCYETHCKEIPSAWKMTSADDITAQVTKTCKASCAESTVDTCKEDCAKTCDGQKMLDCVKPIAHLPDPATDFCQDLWTLLHATSAVDPITGNPVIAK